MNYFIYVLRNTSIKASIRKLSHRLPPNLHVALRKGQMLKVKQLKQELDYWYIELAEPIGDFCHGYIYRSHVQLLDENKDVIIFPVNYSDDLESSIVRYSLLKKHSLEFGPDLVNIFYIVNYAEKGTGFRITIDVDEEYRPRLLGMWPAIIAYNDTAYHVPPQQVKAWTLVNDRLVQAASISVRDAVGTLNRGMFGLDQTASVHDTRMQIGNTLAATSAADHTEFLNVVARHPRLRKLPHYIFKTTVIDINDYTRCGFSLNQ